MNSSPAVPDRSGTATVQTPRVFAVVLNWNGWQDTLTCLGALVRMDYPALSVIVVDNGSTDDSVARIRAAFPNLALVETGCNLGFAGGVNAGIRPALEQGAAFVWLLNNDTVPRADALTALVGKALSDSRFGAVGAVLHYSDRPERVQAWGGGRINQWICHTSHAKTPHEDAWFDYLTAASLLLSRAALEDVGLLDESFFLYWEDTDLSLRLRSRGWQLGVAAGAIVLHKENASSASSRKVARFSTASGIRFLLKHSPAAWLSIPIFLLLRMGKRLVLGRWSHLSDITSGVRDYLASRRRPGGT